MNEFEIINIILDVLVCGIAVYFNESKNKNNTSILHTKTSNKIFIIQLL